jgi:uncharacterized protein (DUF2147 family)
MKTIVISVFLGLGFQCLLVSPAVAQAEISGRWLPPEKDSVVEIYACGDLLCGRIAELAEPLDESGNPKVDTNNEDDAQRGRPLLGMELLNGFSRNGPGDFRDGEIYNPRDGKLYKAVLTLLEDGTLKVRGYVGVPLLGKTQIWTREAR